MYAGSLNNSRDYFFAFLNQAIFESGVSLEGPILPPLVSDFGLAFTLALAAKFFALSDVFLAAALVACLALVAVALAFAGAFLAASLAFLGAALTAFLAAAVVFFVVLEAPSNFLAAAAIFLASVA